MRLCVREREMKDRENHRNTTGSMNSTYKYHQLKITNPNYSVLESTVNLIR